MIAEKANPATCDRGALGIAIQSGPTVASQDKPITRIGQRKGGRRSRDKGNRGERAVVRYLQDHGFAAERVPLSGSAGGSYVGDITVPILGVERTVEVKVRATGFGQLYAWLENRHILVVRADRREPLVVLPLRLAAEIAIAANPNKSDRAIATDLGVDHKTVGAARRELGGEDSPPERVGRDGKIYSLPKREAEQVRKNSAPSGGKAVAP